MTLNPNILDQMAEVEKAAEKATPRPWEWDGLNRDRVDPENTFIWVPQGSHLGDTLITLDDTYEGSGEDCDYIALVANHTPDIIAFTRRLLEVVNLLRDGFVAEACAKVADLERDYPGALGGKEGKDEQD